MDPITHAASGAVAMLAMPRRPATRWAIPLAALAAASPDIDVIFCHTPLQFLLLHRGITHSLAAAPLMGLLLALLSRPLWRAHTPEHWDFAKVWLFMVCMVLLHIWLDVITTYGTMIYLPFSHERVRLNAVFIIDLLLTLPLLWAVLRWRGRRGLMRLALAWVIVYPALCIGLNAWHTTQAEQRLIAEGRAASRIVVLPDGFAPLFWRTIYEEDGPQGRIVYSQGLDALGRPHDAPVPHKAAPPELVAVLARQSVAADAFFDFTLLPVMRPLPADDMPPGAPGTRAAGSAVPETSGRTTYMLFHDLRFGSSLKLVRAAMASRPNADIPFRYMAELEMPAAKKDGTPEAEVPPEVHLLLERLRFSDSGKDSHWQPPQPPASPGILDWLAGLR
ncbi:metal-dependent hydrolase [Desulfovibrio falkowii]|uniref:Membrane-bound metal-dependent hydrolase n=1 Tax=Desulfovibrio falkowii TaxID=3136602 RepID=A0ABQ0EAQ2_9BACT